MNEPVPRWMVEDEVYRAENTIQYILWYAEALKHITPMESTPFMNGFNQAQEDFRNGVVRLHDLDLPRHITTLMNLNRYALKSKARGTK